MLALSTSLAVAAVLMLTLDLGVVNRRGVERPGWVAGLMSALWIALALGFALAIHFTFGHVHRLEFVTG